VNRKTPNRPKEFRPLFWIPMLYNGLCLVTAIIVGMTFLIGSRMPSTAEVILPPVILTVFTLFDILLMISPLMLVVMVIVSIFSLMRENSKMRRFLPLTATTIIQGALSALLLVSITRPAA